MKSFTTTAMLLLGALLFQLKAQNIYLGDTLRIIEAGELKMELRAKNYHYLKTKSDWPGLIASFYQHLQEVRAQVPDYENFRIQYLQDLSMSIEEVQQLNKFKVEQGKIQRIRKKNIAQLIKPGLEIYIYFDEIAELFATDYELKIGEALEKINSGPTDSFFNALGKNRKYYSLTEKKLIKNPFVENRGVKPVYVFGLSLGLFKNKPIYEFSGIGFGLSFGENHRRMIYLSYTWLNQYNEENQKLHINSLLGINYKFDKLGMIELAFPLGDRKLDNYLLNDLRYRLSATVFPVKGISISTDFYMEKDNRIVPGIRLGYGF